MTSYERFQQIARLDFMDYRHPLIHFKDHVKDTYFESPSGNPLPGVGYKTTPRYYIILLPINSDSKLKIFLRKNISNNNTVACSFEEVFEMSSEEMKQKMLFHLDLFRFD